VNAVLRYGGLPDSSQSDRQPTCAYVTFESVVYFGQVLSASSELKARAGIKGARSLKKGLCMLALLSRFFCGVSTRARRVSACAGADQRHYSSGSGKSVHNPFEDFIKLSIQSGLPP
jgi:hypothetical protein